MWVSAPAVIKSIMEALLSRVSTLKSQCCLIHHKTLYDGVFEKASWIFPPTWRVSVSRFNFMPLCASAPASLLCPTLLQQACYGAGLGIAGPEHNFMSERLPAYTHIHNIFIYIYIYTHYIYIYTETYVCVCHVCHKYNFTQNYGKYIGATRGI